MITILYIIIAITSYLSIGFGLFILNCLIDEDPVDSVTWCLLWPICLLVAILYISFGKLEKLGDKINTKIKEEKQNG